MQLILRRLKEKDISRIIEMAAEIEYQTKVKVSDKTIFWSAEELKNWIKKSNDPLIVAEREGEIIGFVLFAIHQPTEKAALENILVAKEFRRQGIATKMLRTALKEMKKQKVKYICSLVKIGNRDVFGLLTSQKFTQGYRFHWFEKTWRK